MLAILLIIPLLLALILVAALPSPLRKYAKYIAFLGSVASLTLLAYVSTGSYSSIWFNIGTLSFTLDLSVGSINLLLLLIVLLTAPLVLLYSWGFMDTPSQQKRFYVEMLGFEAAMVLFAMSAGFITLFIAWELLSLMSYLLIGFWSERRKAARSARKAITCVFIGDIALLSVLAIVAASFGTFSFSSLIGAASSNLHATILIVLLLSVAILSKSAQFPFAEWLPDAMEGPTPVSAFLHSATMVKAGVFLLVLLLPLFQITGLNYVIMAASAITVVIGTVNAMKETQVKRVLAYSTVQELGLMLFAVSSGAVLAGLFLLFAQTFYKAVLFLGAGATMKATDKEDIRELSGLRENILIYLPVLFGVLSLAGFIPFDGFFSSLVLGSSFSANLLAYLGISLVSMLSSAYIFRWMLNISRKPKSQSESIHYGAMPLSTVIPILIFGIATLVASAAFVYFPSFINSGQPSFSLQTPPFTFSLLDVVAVLAFVAAGAAISYFAYAKKWHLRSRVLGSLMLNGLLFDSLYTLVANFFLLAGEAAALLDRSIDGFFEGLGSATMYAAGGVRRVSFGKVNLYALAVALAILIMVAVVYLVR